MPHQAGHSYQDLINQAIAVTPSSTPPDPVTGIGGYDLENPPQFVLDQLAAPTLLLLRVRLVKTPLHGHSSNHLPLRQVQAPALV